MPNWPFGLFVTQAKDLLSRVFVICLSPFQHSIPRGLLPNSYVDNILSRFTSLKCSGNFIENLRGDTLITCGRFFEAVFWRLWRHSSSSPTGKTETDHTFVENNLIGAEHSLVNQLFWGSILMQEYMQRYSKQDMTIILLILTYSARCKLFAREILKLL